MAASQTAKRAASAGQSKDAGYYGCKEKVPCLSNDGYESLLYVRTSVIGCNPDAFRHTLPELSMLC